MQRASQHTSLSWHLQHASWTVHLSSTSRAFSLHHWVGERDSCSTVCIERVESTSTSEQVGGWGYKQPLRGGGRGATSGSRGREAGRQPLPAQVPTTAAGRAAVLHAGRRTGAALPHLPPHLPHWSRGAGAGAVGPSCRRTGRQLASSLLAAASLQAGAGGKEEASAAAKLLAVWRRMTRGVWRMLGACSRAPSAQSTTWTGGRAARRLCCLGQALNMRHAPPG